MTTIGTIKLQTVVTGVDNPAYQVSQDEWNDTLVVGGGADGDVMVRDSTQADGWGLLTAGLVVDADSNIALGLGSFAANTTGTRNVAIGSLALAANTVGVRSIAIGYGALKLATTVTNNIAIGDLAMASVSVTGSSNVAIGSSAGTSLTLGQDNQILGVNALFSGTEASQNVAIGTNALYFNTTGNNNVAIGSEALTSSLTASLNIGIGLNALFTNIVGTRNVAVGNNALELATASDNTALGSNALAVTTTGEWNVAVGSAALFANTTGQWNTALGTGALTAATTASGNVAVGLSAGVTETGGNANVSGSNNVWIGTEAGPGSASQLTNSIGIGYRSHPTASNQVVLGNSSITATTLYGSITFSGATSLTTGTGATYVSGANTLVGAVADKLNAGHLAIAAQAIGDLLYADSTTTFTRRAAVASGSVLVSAGTGTAPAWSASPTLTSLAINSSVLVGGAAANVLEQRNGTNAQIQRWYETYTDASNYSRFKVETRGAGSVLIGTEAAGSGTQRAITFVTGNGSARWEINTTGHLVAGTDNTYDIGASAATRPRTGWFGTALAVGATPASSGLLRFPNNVKSISYAGVGGAASYISTTFDTGNIFRFDAGTIYPTGYLFDTAANVGLSVTANGVVSIRGASSQLIVSGVGPHAIGGATNAFYQYLLTGASPAPYGLVVNSTFSPAPNGSSSGAIFSPTFVEAASGTHSLFATHQISIATVTAGAATVTNTASLYIAGAMTATVSGVNYAMWVDSGASRFDGDIGGATWTVPNLYVTAGNFATSIAVGTTPATAGAIRLRAGAQPGGYLIWNNAAGSANIFGLGIDADDQMYTQAGSFSPYVTGGGNLGQALAKWLNVITSGYYEGTEMTAPAAGAANTGRLFFQDNGAGKTQLMCLFNTGAAQQVAIQP